MGDDGIARLRIKLGKSQVLQLLAHVLHADAPFRPAARANVHRLLRNATALLGLFDVAQGAHVLAAASVRPVLDQQHADVAGDGQHQLAEILRLLGAFGKTSSWDSLVTPSTRLAISLPNFSWMSS